MNTSAMPKAVAERMRARAGDVADEIALATANGRPHMVTDLYDGLVAAGVRAGLEWAMLTASDGKEASRIGRLLNELDAKVGTS